MGNRKKWKEGYVEINFERGGCAEHLRAWIVEDHGRECVVRFEWTAPMTFGELLEYLGADSDSALPEPRDTGKRQDDLPDGVL